MVDDEWVKIARVEDTMVAELLLRLKGVGVGVGVNMMSAPPTAAMASTSKQKQAVLIEWRVRQRRSKAVTVQQQQQQHQQQMKDQAPRDSPSTPLSFSGGATTSVSFGRGGGGGSGGGGGPEDQAESSEISAAESAPKACEMTRSKAVRSSESNTIRKSQKKKTLAELKAEDEYLARERMDLQRELKSVRDNLEKERAKNDNFKRIKLQQEMEFVHSAPVIFQPIVATNNDTLILQHSSSAGITCPGPKSEEPASGGFALPDLNLPLEENFNSLY